MKYQHHSKIITVYMKLKTGTFWRDFRRVLFSVYAIIHLFSGVLPVLLHS